MHRRTRATLLVSLGLLAGLSLPSNLRAFGRCAPIHGAYGHAGYRGGPYGARSRFGYHPIPYQGGPRYGPSYLYSDPYYVPPVRPYVPLSKDERYLGAKTKGDRAAERGDWPKAVAQYRDAQRRAERFWGEGSRQAQDAGRLLESAEYKLRMRLGQAPRGDFHAALARGDRAAARGTWGVAERHYQAAMQAAASSAEAETASSRLRAAKAGQGPAPRGDWALSRESSAE